MKLGNLANISEILSSIAIVITLIVLVFEVQGNTDALQRQMDNDRASRLSDIYDSPYLPGIFAKMQEVDNENIGGPMKAVMEGYNLTYEEAYRVTLHYSTLRRGYEADFLSNQPGAEDREAQMIRLLNSRDQALYWESVKFRYNQEFVEHMNRLIQTTSE